MPTLRPGFLVSCANLLLSSSVLPQTGRPILPPPKKKLEGLQDAKPRNTNRTREVDDEQVGLLVVCRV
eukprot:757711-Hanusia_phi.AAC.3